MQNQYDIVENVIQENGGFATLAFLYHTVLKHPAWKSASKTQQASIRRIVQDTSRFTKIRPGLYCLNGMSATLQPKLTVPQNLAEATSNPYDHYYYQGLLVQTGNFGELETYVPPQDKNRPFLTGKLADIVTVPTCYPFTYPEICRFAATVDVIWFNRRHLPHTFFEVEHSTDIYNSLRKFVNLQDFAAHFVIVADETRLAEYRSKRDEPTFEPVRNRIRFLSYQNLEERLVRLSAPGVS